MTLFEFSNDEKKERLACAETSFNQEEGIDEEEMDLFFECLT